MTTNIPNSEDTDATSIDHEYTHRILVHDVEATAPNPDYSLDFEEYPGLHSAYLARLLDDYPLLMHVLQAVVQTDGVISHSTIYDYHDSPAIARDDIQEAFWLLERLNILTTDDHNKYLTCPANDIYMSFSRIASKSFENNHTNINRDIDLREFTLPRLLVLDVLISNHYHGGFTMQEIEENWGIPVVKSTTVLQWLLKHDLVKANMDETYEANKDNENVKNLHQIQHELTMYGAAIPHHDVATTYEHTNE